VLPEPLGRRHDLDIGAAKIVRHTAPYSLIRGPAPPRAPIGHEKTAPRGGSFGCCPAGDNLVARASAWPEGARGGRRSDVLGGAGPAERPRRGEIPCTPVGGPGG